MQKRLKKGLSVLLTTSMLLSMVSGALAAVEPSAPGDGGDSPPGGPGGPGGGGSFTLPEGNLSIGIKDGIVVDPETPGAAVYEVPRIVTGSDDNISSFSGGGTTEADDDYAFITALYVKDGIVQDGEHNRAADGSAGPDYSVAEAISSGTYSNESAQDVVIASSFEGFNPIIVQDSHYTISGADIRIDSAGDGSKTCDFSGLGAAIAAYGPNALLTVEHSNVEVSGVANLALFADDGANVIVKNSTLHSDGGTLYADYKNSPSQDTMVAPPWILGIMGTSRATNLMGTDSSTTVIDSDVSAAQWAVLSTDSGSNMKLNVVNSTMELTGADYNLQADGTYSSANPYTSRSGYGTYAIGNADEYFYGVDMSIGTYATIFTGGSGTYTALESGKAITLTDAGSQALTTYTPNADKVTSIASDTFGFMIHQGSNNITIEKGTVVDSGYTTFLLKTGSSVDAAVTSGAQLNPGNGILIQAMDNDDATTGMVSMAEGFSTTHTEYAGWPTVAGSVGKNTGTFSFDDVTLLGDIYNATGYAANDKGAQKATPLSIALTGDTSLTGAISATSAIHVTKEGSDAVAAAPAGGKASEDWLDYQLTSFNIGEYWNIGQVANKVYFNGSNTIDVTLTDNAVWSVTADGIVNDLTAASSAITAEAPVTLTVTGTLTLDGQPVTETTQVGNVTYQIASLSGSVVISGTTTYPNGLVIAADAEISAPDDAHAVVMTVNGTQVPLAAGTYNGAVVLNVVKLVEDVYSNHGTDQAQTMTVALSIGDSGVIESESALSALVGGTYDDTGARNVTITSLDDNFGGIRVSGNATYTIENCTIDLTGNGGNDFTGIGAAIAAADNATVIVKHCVIYTEGALRGAFSTSDNATLTVEDSEVHTKSLWAEDGTTLAQVSIPTAGMTTPPTGLGVFGNNRATNVVGYANVTYTNCKIYADSWGAMGTDDVKASADDPSFLNLKDCHIEVAGSGYGAYAIGHIWDMLDGTDVVVDNGMGVIVAAEGSAKLFNGATITSNRFGIVTHQGMGSVSNIVVTGAGTNISAKYTGIQIKERSTNIEVSDGAAITVKNGALIQAVPNDDRMAGSLGENESITVNLKNTVLTGDVLQSLAGVPMNITLNGATLTGGISTAEAVFLNGGTVPMMGGDPHTVGIVTSNTLKALDDTMLSLTLTGAAVWNVTKTSYLTSLTVGEGATVSGCVYIDGTQTAIESGKTYTGAIKVTPETQLKTWIKDGNEVAPNTNGADCVVTDLLTTGNLGSWSGLKGAKLPYRTALYVNNGSVDANNSVLPGLFDSEEGLNLTTATSGFSALILKDSDYTLKNATITMNTDSDGKDVNDFAGYGAGVAVFGDSTAIIEDSTITTTGVAKAATFADDGADLIVRGSTLRSNGGTIYSDYKSTANQALMINPPWVLGISGSARTTNVMGNYTTGTYVDTHISSQDWGAVSIDTGSYMHLSLINSAVTVDGSGYGAYAIGTGTIEDYYGSSFDVDTYAIIMTGATANLSPVKKGAQIPVYKIKADADARGGSAYDESQLVTTETATKTANTVVNSKNFGFMFHHNASSGWNVLNINEGTKITTGAATFLVKKINAEINVNDAKLTTDNGVILQMIDNDDDMVGAYMDADFGMPTFNSSFEEDAGWSYGWTASENSGGETGGPGGPGGGMPPEMTATASASGEAAAASTEAASSNWVTELNVTGTTLKGDLYNGSGYTSNPAMDLDVTLGEDAFLTGHISLTAYQHDWKTFTYRGDTYDAATAASAAAKLGHVTNTSYDNGVSTIDVTLTGSGVWTVTPDVTGSYTDQADETAAPEPTYITNLISSLTVDSTSQIKGAGTIYTTGYTVNGVQQPAGTYTVGNVTIVVDSSVTNTYTGAVLTDVTYVAEDGKAHTDSQKVSEITSYTIKAGGKTTTYIVPFETYNAVLTVDGVQVDFDQYRNKAAAALTVSLVKKGDAETGSGVKKFFQGATQPNSITYYTRTAAWIEDGVLLVDRSVQSALQGGTTNSSRSNGVTIRSEGGFFSGYYINGGTYGISDLKMTLNGYGGDDFQGWGAGIMVTGGADVTLDNAYIDTTGVIRTAIWAGGKNSKLDVTDSVVVAHNDDSATPYSDSDNYAVPMMEKVPFALGLEGNVRATNVLGSATAAYTDSIVVSDAWGALSTDSGTTGTKALDVSNVLSGIGYLEPAQAGKTYTATKEVNGITYGFTVGRHGESSGYVTYADAGVYDMFENVDFYAPDYIGIVASGSSVLYMKDSYGYSDRVGFLIHQNQGTENAGFAAENTGFSAKGGVYVDGGSYDVADTFVLVKGGSINGSYTKTNVEVDGAQVNLTGKNAQSGVLFQLMQADDAGSPGVTSYTISDKTYQEILALTPDKTVDATTAAFSNMTVTGDIYNSIYKTQQALDVKLSNVKLTGVVSSSVETHVDASGTPVTGAKTVYAKGFTPAGETYDNDYLYIGRIVNQAAPAIHNAVNLTLNDGSVWTVSGTSYLNSLVLNGASTLAKSGSSVTVYAKSLTVNGTVYSNTTRTLNGVTVVVGTGSSGSSGGSGSSSSGSGSTTTVPDTSVPTTDLPAFAALTDVVTGSWYYDAVRFVMEEGLFQGTSATTFEPLTNMNRAMVATVLYRLAGAPAVSGNAAFGDVTAGTWYSNAVVWASANGIVTGYGNGLFGAGDLVTRQELVTMLYRFARLMGYDVSAAADLTAFPDGSSTAAWSEEAMRWAVSIGLVQGSSGQLDPSGTATRAEVAAILMRFSQSYT